MTIAMLVQPDQKREVVYRNKRDMSQTQQATQCKGNTEV